MIEKSSKKRKPARSEDDKKELFEKIIKVGADMFSSEQGFSTRKLANKCHMTQGNLYNYVSSKRELWIAIRRHDFQIIKQGFKTIINNHSGPYIELIEKLLIYFLDYSNENPNSWKMMFIIDPPKSKKRGNIEKTYKPVQLFEVVLDILHTGVERGEIRDVSPLVIYSLVVGAVLTETDIKLSNRDKVIELVSDSSLVDIGIENFRKSFLQTIRYLLIP